MATYFEAIDNSGHVIIDDTTPRLVFTRELSVNSGDCIFSEGPLAQYPSPFNENWKPAVLPAQYRAVYNYKYRIYLQGNERSVAIYSTLSDTNIAYMMRKINSTSTVELFISILNGASTTSISTILANLHVYAIANVVTDSNKNYGLKVYNASGGLVFDSNQKIVDIRGTYANTLDGIGAATNSYGAITSVSSNLINTGLSRNYAVLVNCYGGSHYRNDSYGTSYTLFTYYVAFASDTIRLRAACVHPYFIVSGGILWYDSRVIGQADAQYGILGGYNFNINMLSIKV